MNQWQEVKVGKGALAWRLTGSAFTIILRPVVDGEGWVATCHAIDMESKVMQASGHVAAKREAVLAVVAEIRRMASEAERVFLKHGKARLSELES